MRTTAAKILGLTSLLVAACDYDSQVSFADAGSRDGGVVATAGGAGGGSGTGGGSAATGGGGAATGGGTAATGGGSAATGGGTAGGSSTGGGSAATGGGTAATGGGTAATGGGTAAAGGGSAGAGTGGGTPTVVVVGYGGRRARSTDGSTWTNFQQITANGGDDDNLFRGVGYGNGTFVAVGGSTHCYTMTSTDGITWANENRTLTAWLGGVAALGTNFVAAGGNGMRVRSTDNGRTWQNEAGYQPIHYRAVTSSGSLVVAVGHNYDSSPNVGVIATTADGITWTQRMRAGGTFGEVAFGNGTFIATGSGGRVARSSDGITWTDVTLAGTGGASVAFAGTEFVVTFDSTAHRSTNGVTWTQSSTSHRVAGFFNGKYLGLGWPAAVFAGASLTSWTTAFSPGGSGLTGLAVGVAH